MNWAMREQAAEDAVALLPHLSDGEFHWSDLADLLRRHRGVKRIHKGRMRALFAALRELDIEIGTRRYSTAITLRGVANAQAATEPLREPLREVAAPLREVPPNLPAVHAVYDNEADNITVLVREHDVARGCVVFRLPGGASKRVPFDGVDAYLRPFTQRAEINDEPR